MNHENRAIGRIAFGCFALCLFVLPAHAQSISSLRAEALTALMKGDSKTAIEAADKIVRDYPNDTRAMRLSADIFLRAGKPLWAARMFNRYLEEEPGELPTLWQRGIALYFTGDHKDAAKQFETHRKFNPHDVENAAWHFLCVSKAKSFAAAKKNVLPAPNDPRVPMKEILEMLKTGDTDSVNERVNKTKVDTRERESAAFFGDFYLGLYADAQGDKDTAKKYMKRAAEDAPRNYMGDVARVYDQYLNDKLK